MVFRLCWILCKFNYIYWTGRLPDVDIQPPGVVFTSHGILVYNRSTGRASPKTPDKRD